ncbi:hypothetical protein WJX82_008900 [Trebouxia sp. C0006]
MADQSEKELAAVFDLLKISLSKTDPTLDKSNALKGLVVAAVARAEAAGELKSGNPNQIATDVCITLRYLTGGLLTSGVAGVESSILTMTRRMRAHPQHRASLHPSPDGLGAVTPKWAPLRTLTSLVQNGQIDANVANIVGLDHSVDL